MASSGPFRAGVILALVAVSGPGWAEGIHAFSSDPNQCGRCHVDSGNGTDPTTFRKDIVSLCLECHGDKDLSRLHPVDIRPGLQVPPDLPLDEHGTITCATCHDVHGASEADQPHVAQALGRRLLSLFTGQTKHRTFFLRRRNDEGQLCLGCHRRSSMAAEGFHVLQESLLDRYGGSASCSPCHPGIFEAWRKTPHARMVGDARADPSCVLAEFGPDAPFPKAGVVYSLGVHWTQRYVVEKGGKLYVKAPIWSITQQSWDTSYWIDKPWTPYCQGCHTTGFEMGEGPRFAELGVGCEACHGPARAHAESGGAAIVLNPADLDPTRRDMICESCHTTGHDRSGQFRYPLGYLPGADLSVYYRGLLPRPGQDNSTFLGDGSYEDRHRQWLFWIGTFLDAKGLNCDVCKNFRNRAEPSEKARMTPSEYCLSCHDGEAPLPIHDAHRDGGVGCHECHAPALGSDGKTYSIHDHKFLFLPPPPRPPAGPTDTCRRCHTELARSEGG